MARSRQRLRYYVGCVVLATDISVVQNLLLLQISRVVIPHVDVLGVGFRHT